MPLPQVDRVCILISCGHMDVQGGTPDELHTYVSRLWFDACGSPSRRRCSRFANIAARCQVCASTERFAVAREAACTASGPERYRPERLVQTHLPFAMSDPRSGTPVGDFSCIGAPRTGEETAAGTRSVVVDRVRPDACPPRYFVMRAGISRSGRSASWSTFSATEPITKRSSPVRPCVLIAIRFES
jgi:hypothetical protein